MEIREYLVSIDMSINKPKYEYIKNIQVHPIKMQFVIFNQNYLNDIIISDPEIPNLKQAVENHRLISKIDDDGNINGSMLLFNHKQSNYGIWQITNDAEIIKLYHPEEDANLFLNSYIFVLYKNGY
jgi:hypothetical protein